MYLFKTGASIERFISNACNAVTNCYAFKTGAPIERTPSNACNAVRDCYAGKTGAFSERPISNACNAGRDCYAGKTTATIERFISNACNAIGCTGICNTSRNYYTIVIIATTIIISISHRNCFGCTIGDIVINTVDLKIISIDNYTAQQQQCCKKMF